MLPIFLVATLVISSGFVSAIKINSGETNIEPAPDNSSTIISSLGAGGWHNEESMVQNGDELTDVYSIENGDGSWEYPYDGNCAHIWAAHGQNDIERIVAEYTFDVNDGPVKYVKYEINYKDVGLFSDGPNAKIYRWDDSWNSKSNIGDGHHYGYDWEEYTFDDNDKKYVNNDGEIRVGAEAWDDDTFFHQDDLSIKNMKISYQTADEEIFTTEYNTYDSDDDGSDDSVEVIIDADVGDFGDGTTVDVTAQCELVDPDGKIVSAESVTWTIVDHQLEYGTVNLSAVDGINGEYTVNIVLYDQHENIESNANEVIFLEPDPQRAITFYTDPYDAGEIIFDGTIYHYADTTLTSDGTYDISATPPDYYAFDYWEIAGDVNVSDQYSNETQITINGDAIIIAHFEFMLNTVYFLIEPEEGGWIVFAGYDFYNATGCYTSNATYNISAVQAQSEYYFIQWASTENITIADEYAQTTTATINGDGIIAAYFVLNEPPDTPSRPYGSISGEINVAHSYSTSTTDPNDGEVYYLFDWGDGTDSGWIGPYNSGQTIEASHKWTGTRDYEIKVKSKDEYGAESDWSEILTVTMYGRPSIPIIKGPASGKPRNEYEYTFTSSDPDEEDLYYYIEWGDGEFEDWIGPYNSGEEITLTHTWADKQMYTIRAMSKDSSGVTSEWGTLSVNMPRNRLIQTIFYNFLQEHPLMYQLLQRFLKL